MSTNASVKEFMSENIISVGKDTPLKEARDILLQNNIHHLLVLEKGDYVGIISSNDIIRIEPEDLNSSKVEAIMATEVICIQEQGNIGEAVNLLMKYQFNSLPVVDKGNKVIGILTSRDILKAFVQGS